LPRSLYPREITPIPFEKEDGWGPEPVWTVLEKIECEYTFDF